MSDSPFPDPPRSGEKIVRKGTRLQVPSRPIVPFVAGDGAAAACWPAVRTLLDAAVARSYRGKRQLEWVELHAGAAAHQRFGQALPEDSIEALLHFMVALVGPLDDGAALLARLATELDLAVELRWLRAGPGAGPNGALEGLDLLFALERSEGEMPCWHWPRGADPTAALVTDLLERQRLRGLRFAASSALQLLPFSAEGRARLLRASRAWHDAQGRQDLAAALIEPAGWAALLGLEPGPWPVLGPDAALVGLLEDPRRLGLAVGHAPAAATVADALTRWLGPQRVPLALLNPDTDHALFAPALADADPSAWVLAGALLLRHLGWHEPAAQLEATVRQQWQAPPPAPTGATERIERMLSCL